MENTNTQYWYSSDWKQQNSLQTPYNGIKIKATAFYNADKKNATYQNLSSVDLVITDYTKNTNGISSKLTLTNDKEWEEIPIPKNKTTPKLDFTITGNNSEPGRIKLENTTTGNYLNINFNYGVTNNIKTILGFILKI